MSLEAQELYDKLSKGYAKVKVIFFEKLPKNNIIERINVDIIYIFFFYIRCRLSKDYALSQHTTI